jgi:hypothetical protein
MTEDEKGLLAVRAKFGPGVEQRIRNWPLIAEQWYRAHLNDEDTVAEEIEAAKRNVARAMRDKDWALEQAEMIVRSGIEREDLLTVPSAQLIRKRQEEADARAQTAGRKWREGNE